METQDKAHLSASQAEHIKACPSNAVLIEVFNYLQRSPCRIEQGAAYLYSKQLITYIPFGQFVERIADCVGDTENCQERFEQSKVINASEEYDGKSMVPFPCKSSPLFLRQVCRCFYEKFLTQDLKANKSTELSEIEQKEQNKDNGFYQFQQVQGQTQPRIYLPPILQQHSKQKKDEEANKYTKESVRSNLKHFQPQNCFRDQKGNVRPSVSQLLSVDLTSIFAEEIEEVKKIVIQQLSDECSYLSETYSTFFERYRFYSAILKGEYENGKDMLDIKREFHPKEYERYLSGNEVRYFEKIKSSFLKCWEKIFDEAKPQYQQKAKTSFRQIFQEKVKRVFVYYVPAQPKNRTFVSSDEDGVFININHFEQGSWYELTIDNIRCGLLRPYLLLCLYRELARMLARDLKHNSRPMPSETFISEQGKELSHSSDPGSSSDSVGSAILRIVHKKIAQIKQAFGEEIECTDDFQDKKINAKIIDTRVGLVVEFLNQSKQAIQILRNKFSLSIAVQKKLNALKFTYPKVRHIFSEESLKEILDDFRKRHQEKFEKNLSDVKQAEYDFVKAVFFSLEDLAFRTIGKDYYLAKDAVQRGCLYFSSHNGLIEAILKQIQKVRGPIDFSCQEAKDFVDLYSEQKPIQKLSISLQDLIKESSLHELGNFRGSMPEFIPLKQQSNSLYDSGLLKASLLRSAEKVLEAQRVYRESMNYIKHSEIFKVASQLPSFIFSEGDSAHDAGYYFEQMLLPNLRESGAIYAKDFQLLQNLTSEGAKNVGMMPQSIEEKKWSMTVDNIKRDKKAPARRFKCDFYDDYPNLPFEDLLKVRPQDCGTQEHFDSLQETFRSVIKMRCLKPKKKQQPEAQSP